MIVDRVYFDMGVFTFWSEESLDNKRLIAKGGVLVSDDAALKEVMDGSDPLDMDLVEMLTNLSEDGFELNICDTLSVSEIQDLLGDLGIGDFFSNIVSAKSARPFANSLNKLRGKEDFSIFVGTDETVIEACSMAQIPVIAYGEKYAEVYRSAFCGARYPLEVEDQIYTTMVVHYVARKTIEKNARLLGIDGIDYAGKKFFADKLCRYFDILGKEYNIVYLEDYHRAVEASYKGEDPVEAYYFNGFNTEKLITEVIKPFKREGKIDKVVYCLDSTNDSFVNERHYELSEDGVMILIGTMMYREPLIRYFDTTVYMRVDYRESEHRASLEETPIYGDDPVEVYKTKQIPAQKMYIQRHDPFEGRDFVIDNSNYHRPFFIV